MQSGKARSLQFVFYSSPEETVRRRTPAEVGVDVLLQRRPQNKLGRSARLWQRERDSREDTGLPECTEV